MGSSVASRAKSRRGDRGGYRWLKWRILHGRFKGRAAGTFGLGGAIRFYPAKTLGCLGDGGCVITNDDAIYEKLILYRDHGRNDDGDVVLWAMN